MPRRNEFEAMALAQTHGAFTLTVGTATTFGHRHRKLQTLSDFVQDITDHPVQWPSGQPLLCETQPTSWSMQMQQNLVRMCVLCTLCFILCRVREQC